MIPSRETKYFKIGLFVIIGLALIILGIILLSSGKLFRNTIHVETYFSESIQGLSKGSPVKYRGVTIGSVEEISFVSEIYEKQLTNTPSPFSRYVYVKMIIMPDLFVSAHYNRIREAIARDVTQGLRVKLALQGLTGNAYLELNFVDPKQDIPPKINWVPENYYIPSTTSTLTLFSDNVQYLLEELKKAKLQQMFTNVEKLANTTNNVMIKIDGILARTGQQFKATADNAEIISENLRTFSARIKEHPSQLIFGKAPPILDPNSL